MRDLSQNMNENFRENRQMQFQIGQGLARGISHQTEIAGRSDVKLDWIQSSLDRNEMLSHLAAQEKRIKSEIKHARLTQDQNFREMQFKYEMQVKSAEIEARREERREDRQYKEKKWEREEKRREDEKKSEMEERKRVERKATGEREWKELQMSQKLIYEETIRRERHDEEIKRLAREEKFKFDEIKDRREFEILKMKQNHSQFLIKAALAVFMALIFASIFVIKSHKIE